MRCNPDFKVYLYTEPKVFGKVFLMESEKHHRNLKIQLSILKSFKFETSK